MKADGKILDIRIGDGDTVFFRNIKAFIAKAVDIVVMRVCIFDQFCFSSLDPFFLLHEERFWLHELRSGDLEDRLYQRRLIMTFIKAVFVYDNRLRIQFNYGTESKVPTGPGSSSEFAPGPEWGTIKVRKVDSFRTFFVLPLLF